MRLRAWAMGAALAVSAAAVFAAEDKSDKPKPPPPPAYITEQEAGPDYAVQGEYEGQAGGARLGVQVIALGNGRFRAVLYPDGLPGAGSNGKTRTQIEGHTQDNKAIFSARGYTLTIANGSIAGKNDKGETIEARRVIRHSPTENARAPEGAIVLFDGSGLDAWNSAKMDDRRLLSPQSGSGPSTKQQFKDFTLHIEFILPFMPTAGGQGRANSGVYLQGRYEVQVLDSFGLENRDDDCGGIYKNATALVNMCLPPLQWQTYDIDFTAARWDGNHRIAKAIVTVKHNGVVIHDNLHLEGPTNGGPKTGDERGDGPLYLQNHGNPVFYRNIWIAEKK